MIEHDNIYYFRNIQKIGGIETFLYELAKKFKDKDIAIVYHDADKNQVKRLRKYVRCIKHMQGNKYKCKKAFFNFNLDIIDEVEAEEYSLVIHGNYKWMPQGGVPTHPKINHYYAVSQDSADAFTEITGKPCEVAYNPLHIEPEDTKEPIVLVSASRLADANKGADLMTILARKMDEYSEKHQQPYLWLIFTKNFNAIKSKNIAYMEARTDIRPYMKFADWVVQLSKNVEGYNYTINESLSKGIETPVIATPCDVYKELGIDKTMAVFLDFNLKNIDEVVEAIFTKKLKPKYEPPKDRWDELFADGKSKYNKEEKIRVRALKIFNQYRITDTELGRVPEENEEWEVSNERLDVLLGDNAIGKQLVEIVNVNKEHKATKNK